MASMLDSFASSTNTVCDRVRPHRSMDCQQAGSLAELLDVDLASLDLAICSMELVDGTGIDALGYLHSAAPDLPVVLVSLVVDPALAREAIQAGAINCLVKDDHFFDRLPLAIEATLTRCEQMSERDRLQRQLNDSLVELIDEVTQLQTMISHLEMVAVTDDLTGLHNRRRLSVAIEEQWRESRKAGESLAFLMIDIDQFKVVNDRFGHQRGDALLQLLGRVLRDNTREADVVVRYGGDEFCVLMPAITVDDASRTACRIAHVFADEAQKLIGDELHMGVSIGVAHTSLSTPTRPIDLISHADEAMYTAKREGDRVMIRRSEGVDVVEDQPAPDALAREGE